MKFRPEEIKPTLENPFEADLLERKQYADVLTQIVKNAEDGFTLSINADWGYGKTTFVKMWDAMLQSEGYKTIYFNAWESDFVSEPMMALIDGLRNGYSSKDLSAEKLQLTEAFWKAATRLVKLVPQWRVIGEVAEIFQEGVKDCLENKTELQECLSVKKVVSDFRKQLTSFAEKISDSKQLIVFVDELDRCRPDYAVQILERIKHFFAIDNIIFVLAIDKNVICKSIKAYYGGLDIDTDAYLRRFIDLEFDLPEPDISNFVEALYRQKEIGVYFTNYWDYLRKVYDGQDYEVKLKATIVDCFRSESISLRDVEKFFSRLELILNSKNLPHNSSGLIIYLLYLCMFHKDLYQELGRYKLEIPDMWTKLNGLIESSKIGKESETYHRFAYISVTCLACYLSGKERYDNYRKALNDFYHDDSNLQWLPKEYRDWLKREMDNYKTAPLKDLFPHIELINARFDIEIAR